MTAAPLPEDAAAMLGWVEQGGVESMRDPLQAFFEKASLGTWKDTTLVRPVHLTSDHKGVSNRIAALSGKMFYTTLTKAVELQVQAADVLDLPVYQIALSHEGKEVDASTLLSSLPTKQGQPLTLKVELRTFEIPLALYKLYDEEDTPEIKQFPVNAYTSVRELQDRIKVWSKIPADISSERIQIFTTKSMGGRALESGRRLLEVWRRADQPTLYTTQRILSDY